MAQAAAPLIRPAATFSPRCAKGEGVTRSGVAGGSRSGVALVATLIMLSLVTFMVVAFLGVARRERRAIEAATTQGESQVARDAAFNFAQADILARLLISGDKWNYGVMVSTNFQNPLANLSVAGPLNVNHTNGLASGLNFWLTNLANLQYKPRPPVFSPSFTNTLGYAAPGVFSSLLAETNAGRFYLDFNRNGIFDPTDRNHPGDPQWIGQLEYPDAPHGPTNRFVSRYAYFIAPAGKAMDLNLIHNQAKLPAVVTAEGYYRNLGLGPQEFNLAAMLTEMTPGYYLHNYDLNAANPSFAVPNGRDAFRDALLLLRFRNNDSYNNHATLAAQFGATPAQFLTNANFDVLGNGGLMGSTNLLFNVDQTNIPWPGGTNVNAQARHYFDLTELFSATRPNYQPFTTNLHYVSTNLANTLAGDADRRAPYRLMEVLGTESWPVTNKLNLNWPNTLAGSPGGEAFGFTNWHPDTFFYAGAELMLRASLTPSVFINTNWTGFGGAETNVVVTNYYLGTTFVGTNFDATLSITNIPIFPFSYYSPEVHRLLQFTANLYDATTWDGNAPAYPTVWRPVFGYANTNLWPSNDFVRIVGYTTNGTDANTLLSLPVYDLSDPNARMQMYTSSGLGESNLCLFAGTPVIIGVKKGYPNFNEFAAQILFSVTRRLEFVKTNATNAGPMAASGRPLFQTNQSLVISMTNVNGFEAWNSYGAAYPRGLRMVASNVADIAIGYFLNRHLTNSVALFSATNFLLVYTNRAVNPFSGNIPANTWLGTAAGLASFKSVLFTNPLVLSTNAAQGYAFATNFPALPGFTNGGFIPASPTGPGSPSIFSRSNGLPDLRLHTTITNSIRYALIEPTANRVVDFVNLANLTLGTNISVPLRAFDALGRIRVFSRPDIVTDGLDVQFFTTGTLPPPLLPWTTYYARDVTRVSTATPGLYQVEFRVALTPGGAAIGIGVGSGNHFLVPPTQENLSAALAAGGTNNGGLFWLTSGRQGGLMGRTDGISNQIALCLETNVTAQTTNSWRQWSFNTPLLREIDRFRKWMGAPGVLPPNQSLNTNVLSVQAPFNPSRLASLSATWEANDPLVHYTSTDLENPFLTLLVTNFALRSVAPPPGTLFRVDRQINGQLTTNYALNFAYQPWGMVSEIERYPTFNNVASFQNSRQQGYYELKVPAYDLRFKDPGVFSSDMWDFPQRKFANLGWIGRVHRGTPWQTFYLKSDIPNPTNWFYWARSAETNPTNDWRLVDVFTTAINADATRGLLSVNQTNSLAWAAALGGTLVLSNNTTTPANWPLVVTPASVQLTNLVGSLTNGLINAKQRIPMWQPVLNYSAGDVVAYQVAPYLLVGDANAHFHRYFLAMAGTNQNQDPFQQAFSAGNFTYWTNVTTWSVSGIYSQGNVVEHFGVSYFALRNTPAGPPDAVPADWEPYPQRSFTRVGAVLSTPELSVRSPFLNIGRAWQPIAYALGARVYWNGWYYQSRTLVPVNTGPPNPHVLFTNPYAAANAAWVPLGSSSVPDALNDVFVERIPQQTLGLMHLEPHPRLAVYAYGQSLRPAERGIYVAGGAFSLMVTNYQITGESAARAVIRIEGLPDPGFFPRPLPAGSPPVFFPRIFVESFKLLSAEN